MRQCEYLAGSRVMAAWLQGPEMLWQEAWAPTDQGCLHFDMKEISCGIKTLAGLILLSEGFGDEWRGIVDGDSLWKHVLNNSGAFYLRQRGIAVPRRTASQRLSTLSPDWHDVIALSSAGTELEGWIPWRTGAWGEMAGTWQAQVFLIEMGPKKRVSVCIYISQCACVFGHLYGCVWRRHVHGTLFSYNRRRTEMEQLLGGGWCMCLGMCMCARTRLTVKMRKRSGWVRNLKIWCYIHGQYFSKRFTPSLPLLDIITGVYLCMYI